MIPYATMASFTDANPLRFASLAPAKRCEES